MRSGRKNGKQNRATVKQPLSCTECGNVRLNDKQKNVAISKNIGHNNDDAMLSSRGHFYATFFNMRQRNFEGSFTAHANVGNTAHLLYMCDDLIVRSGKTATITKKKRGEKKKRWNKVGGWGWNSRRVHLSLVAVKIWGPLLGAGIMEWLSACTVITAALH